MAKRDFTKILDNHPVLFGSYSRFLKGSFSVSGYRTYDKYDMRNKYPKVN